jgi:hypothetical protein
MGRLGLRDMSFSSHPTTCGQVRCHVFEGFDQRGFVVTALAERSHGGNALKHLGELLSLIDRQFPVRDCGSNLKDLICNRPRRVKIEMDTLTALSLDRWYRARQEQSCGAHVSFLRTSPHNFNDGLDAILNGLIQARTSVRNSFRTACWIPALSFDEWHDFDLNS